VEPFSQVVLLGPNNDASRASFEPGHLIVHLGQALDRTISDHSHVQLFLFTGLDAFLPDRHSVGILQ
jgi:hypothetical protein